MHKLLILILCLGISTSCLSQQSICPDVNTIDYENASLIYLQYGNANLLALQPENALENFDLAMANLDTKRKSTKATAFMILFGQIIAYDSLNLAGQRKQAIDSLLSLIETYPKKTSSNPRKHKKITETSKDSENVITFLHELVSVAPSSEIREFLSTMVDSMNETWSFSTDSLNQKISKGNQSHKIPYLECKSKSFWQKVKNFFQEAKEWLALLVQLMEAAKDIKQNHQEHIQNPQIN